MGKKPRIAYLELDEFRYIENDEFKIRVDKRNEMPQSATWDEFWDQVRSDIEKIAAYEQQHQQSQQ